MKIQKEMLHVDMEGPDTIMRSQSGLGGMTVGFHELPAGTDFTPMFQGLPTNSCHCPHWGYIFAGSIRIIYDDGTEELTKAGEIFYWPGGHTAIVEEDVQLMDFSPEKELKEVMENVARRMEELAG